MHTFAGSPDSISAMAKELFREERALKRLDGWFLTKESIMRHEAEAEGLPPVEPVYTQEHALKTHELFRTCRYGERFELCPGIHVRMVDVGHLMGSAAIELTVNEVAPPEEEPTATEAEAAATKAATNQPAKSHYVLNTNTMKFHYPDCSSVGKMKDSNRQDVEMTRDEAINAGYSPCGKCKP